MLNVQIVLGVSGGNPAALGDHPSQVFIYYYLSWLLGFVITGFLLKVSLTLPQGRLCGGTIVNAFHIVTSARCVLTDNNHLIQTTQVTVRAGITALVANSPATVAVVAIFPHPHYSPFTEEHDIAVIRVTYAQSMRQMFAPKLLNLLLKCRQCPTLHLISTTPIRPSLQSNGITTRFPRTRNVPSPDLMYQQPVGFQSVKMCLFFL